MERWFALDATFRSLLDLFCLAGWHFTEMDDGDTWIGPTGNTVPKIWALGLR